MVVFLTSSPTGELGHSLNHLDHQNQFADNLKKYLKPDSLCCLISAYPDHYKENYSMCYYFHSVFLQEDFSVQCFHLIDQRYQDFDRHTLQQYDVIILAGGHVPTQNSFFKKIQLREKIADFQGLIIVISSGSMNSADLVYCQPEEEGESVDPHFQRWIPGLNLTNINIIPHYQMVKDRYLDGVRLYEDITYPDSINHRFIVLVDGSYILIDNSTYVYGESYIIENGAISCLCHHDEMVEI